MQGRLIGVLDEPADHFIAEHVLRMLGVPPDDAARIANLPLDAAAADAATRVIGAAR
jgi:hypothetical protein